MIGFEDGGRGHEPRNAESLQKMEEARNGLSSLATHILGESDAHANFRRMALTLCVSSSSAIKNAHLIRCCQITSITLM